MATQREIAAVLAYLEAATGCPAVSKERTTVYADLLGDLDGSLLMAAARQAALEHRYPTLPPAGAIRQLAVEMQNPPVAGPEAWEMFRTAVHRFGTGKRKLYRAGAGCEVVDNEANGLKSLPERVRRAARAFGWKALADTDDDELSIARTQFLKIYDALGDQADRAALMPPAVKQEAARLAEAFQEQPVKALPKASS